MKKIFKTVLTLGLVAGLGFAAKAQITASATSSATVLADLTITLDPTQNEIAFGNISAYTPSAIVLNAKGTAGNKNTGTNTNVARFDLTGSNSAVTVSYDATVELLNGSPDEEFTMTPEVVGSALAANQASATAVGNASTVTLVSNAYFLWVGGTIPTFTNQAIGDFIGTFNINVEYN